jgi:hypothetical protein
LRAAAAAVLLAACGGAPAPIETTPEAAPVVAPAQLALAAEGSAEPLAVLDLDGTIHHETCALRLDPRGGTIVDASDAIVVAVEGERIVGAARELLFTLEGDVMVRPDGRAARFDADRVRFDESAGLTLRVEGATSPEARRTALLVVAALSICAG